MVTTSHRFFHPDLFKLGFLACILLIFSPPASAFTVIKNVNTGKPPVEKVVLFEKGKPSNLDFTDNEEGKFSLLGDGSLQCYLKGNKEIKSSFTWKPGPGLAIPFDAGAYTFMIITCRVEGVMRETTADGKKMDRRADNLWIGPTLLNSKNERVGTANLADAAEDKKTPVTTSVITIPMLLFTDVATNDFKNITGLGFFIQAGRAGTDRDFRIIIDKIALAE